MKMKSNMKKTVIGLSSLFLLAACNGGGGGGSGSNDTPTPTPSPSPAPAAMQALTFSQQYLDKNGVMQNGAFSLNKVGGHQVWYMVVTNPNAFAVIDNGSFSFETTGVPIDPTAYSTTYNGEISGVTKQCNSILGHGLSSTGLAAGEKCAYKFEAMWGENTSQTTNYSIKMAYSLLIKSQVGSNPTEYIVKSNCSAQYSNQVCLAGIDTEGLSFNLMNLTQSSGNVYGKIGSSEMLTSQYLSMDGTKMWRTNGDNTATSYSVTYNSSTNQISNTVDQVWSGNWFSSTAGLSADGSNIFLNNYNQYGLMTNMNTTDSNTLLDWTYGLDGNLYATGFNTGYYFIMNQTPDASLKNETKSRIAPQVSVNSFLKGVSASGNLWTREATGSYSCLSKNNSYAVTSMNLDGLGDVSVSDSGKLGADGYRNKFVNLSKYTDLKGVSTAFNGMYKINIDSCNVESTNYLTTWVSLTTSYGIYYGTDGSNTTYVLPKSSFSDGTNGN